MSTTSPITFAALVSAIQGQKWIVAGQRILVACSGGLDSVVMLYLLATAAKPGALGVIHLNHGLRSTESDADEQFVRTLARKLKLRFISKKLDPNAGKYPVKKGIEAWAREERYTFFISTLANEGFDLVATAHTADDQLETVLLNIYRGTGIWGLSGIVEKSAWVVRPLLHYRRTELLSVAREKGFKWREDRSNQDWRFTRNRLRLGWLSIASQTLLTQCLLKEQELQTALKRVKDLIKISYNKLEKQLFMAVNDRKILLELPPGTDYFSILWKALFDKAFQHVTGVKTGLGQRQFELVRKLAAQGQAGRELDLPNQCKVVRDRKRVCFMQSGADAWSAVALEPNGYSEQPFFSIQLERKSRPREQFTNTPAEVQYLPGSVGELGLRPWQSGDKMIPFGGKTPKLVSDLIRNSHVASHLKRWFPVLTTGREIIWVPGVKPSEAIRIKENEDTVIRIEVSFNKETFE